MAKLNLTIPELEGWRSPTISGRDFETPDGCAQAGV
jgi:hypothetical protein